MIRRMKNVKDCVTTHLTTEYPRVISRGIIPDCVQVSVFVITRARSTSSWQHLPSACLNPGLYYALMCIGHQSKTSFTIRSFPWMHSAVVIPPAGRPGKVWFCWTKWTGQVCKVSTYKCWHQIHKPNKYSNMGPNHWKLWSKCQMRAPTRGHCEQLSLSVLISLLQRWFYNCV